MSVFIAIFASVFLSGEFGKFRAFTLTQHAEPVFDLIMRYTDLNGGGEDIVRKSNNLVLIITCLRHTSRRCTVQAQGRREDRVPSRRSRD